MTLQSSYSKASQMITVINCRQNGLHSLQSLQTYYLFIKKKKE
jgi:hypothetical protein